MDLLRLTRPGNVALFLATAALGGVLVAGGAAFEGEALVRLLFAMLSAALVGAGSNVVNDLYDVEIDRVNRPERPLAKGSVSVRAAWVFWALLSAGGIAAGAWVSALHIAIAAGSVAFLWAYSVWLKGLPLVGNLAVSGMIVLGMAFGGLAVGPPTAALWAGMGWGALILLAREIVKDVEDAPGDRAGGARTLPLAWGERRTTALALAIVASCLTAIPATAEVVGASFYVWSAGVVACLLVALWTLGVALAERAALQAPSARARAWLKGALVASIVGLVIARLS